MLLAHTSGIPEHIQVTAFQDALAADPFKVWKPAEMVAYVLDAKPLFPAGSSFSYADTNYILVGMIIERITGRTYYEVLDERILKPLGLRRHHAVGPAGPAGPGVRPHHAGQPVPGPRSARSWTAATR